MNIKFNNNEIDLSKLEVGKVYKLEMELEGKIVTVPRALIKAIDIKNNDIVYEPLVDNAEFKSQNLNILNSLELFDDNDNLLVKIK